MTPLNAAAGYGDGGVAVRMLLEDPRIDVSESDSHGNTPLINAVRKGRIQVVRTLLEDSRINLHAQNKERQSAKTVAQGSNSSEEIVSMLDREISNRQNMAALGLRGTWRHGQLAMDIVNIIAQYV
eukprot:863803_1